MTHVDEIPYEELRDQATELLGDRLVTPQELAAVLTQNGLDLGSDALALIDDFTWEDDWIFFHTTGGRIGVTATVLENRWFTHRVTASEIAGDFLAAGDDLAPLFFLLHDEPGQLSAGGWIAPLLTEADAARYERELPANALGPDKSGYLLSPGKLAELDVNEGDLVGVQFGEEFWRVKRLSDDDLNTEGDQLCEHIETALNNADTLPAPLEETLLTALADDRDLLLEPGKPLVELFPGRFSLVHGMLAPADFDIDDWHESKRIRSLQRHSDLDEPSARASARIIDAVYLLQKMLDQAFDAVQETEGSENDMERAMDEQDPHLRAFLADSIEISAPWLANPEVASAAFAETVGLGQTSPDALSLFARTALIHAPTDAKPGLWWLMARADEHNGDMKDAEDHFNQAVSIDPDYLPAVLSLAQIANDRGDVLALSRWLKRAGDEADPNLHRLAAQYQPIVRKDAARNAPCPCGSGKKFKQCHMRQTQHPLTDRTLWLYHKALMYQDAEHRDVVLPLAQARVKYSDDPMAMLRSLEDEFVLGTALFEGGVFDQFVALRGSLLPEDELLTAQQWLLTDLSVFEVQSVQPGQGFRLRDLRTGETHQIDEKLGSRKFRRGQYLCTRVMPVAATRQIIGGLEPVAMHLRDPLMELLDEDPDPSEIIDLLSTRFAPPQVQTTEGEKMVICEATITTAHSDRIAAAFSERFRSTEPDTWIEEVEVMGVDRVRGTFHLAGDQLAISTNSVERMNRSLALIKDLDPTHQITSNTKKPMDLTKAARMGNSATSPSPSPEPMDLSANPEIAQALSDMMRKHEDAWVDESIPALDGHTPRQAVADPTRRDDVIRLLDSFPPANGNPGAMDPDRMRSLLGL